MKRSHLYILMIISLLLSLTGSRTTVQAVSFGSSVDFDQDGIPNSAELTGWYNLSGGPYKTDPNKADSDQDGLTDIEEMLFNTNPNDPNSPGIAVKYNRAYKTFEYYRTNDPKYFSMVQGGDQWLLTEGLVIRRGTTVAIAAVNAKPAQLTITGDGLPSLTPVRDPARGGWKVTIPAGAPVGQYTATITNGAFSKSMPVYVIFELPTTSTGLTQEEINTFLYDDNPADRRDEVAVVYRVQDWPYYNNESETPTPCDDSIQVCSNWQYHQSMSYAQAFWTEQYTKNVLTNFAIPAIHGKTNQYNATLEISIKADRSTRVNFNAAQNNFSSATFYNYDVTRPATPYHMIGGACETQAGVYTAILRSSGIPASPFVHSYNKTLGHGEGGNFGMFEYDSAVKMWLKKDTDSTHRWYAERTFRDAEAEYQANPVWTSGTSGLRPLDTAGIYFGNQFNKFQDYHADLIQTVKAGWDFQQGSNASGVVTGLVNTEWGPTGVPASEFAPPFLTRDLKWDSRKPLNMVYQSPYIQLLNCMLWKGDEWAPIEWTDPSQSNPPGRDALRTYILPGNVLPDPSNPIENWPYNPHPTECSPSSIGTPECTAFLLENNTKKVCTPLPGQTFPTAAQPAQQAARPILIEANTAVQLGDITAVTTQDLNGDGRYDSLVVQFSVTSTVGGDYHLGGILTVGDTQIKADPSRVSVVPGTQTRQVTFDGKAISNQRIDGPFTVETIWLYPADLGIVEPVIPEEMAAYKVYGLSTQSYQASSFQMRAAFIADGITYKAANQDSSGPVNTVSISVPLQIDVPGAFTLKGELYDGTGRRIGAAQWNGSESVATLNFSVAGTQPPYSLEQVTLYDAAGNELDARYAQLFAISDLKKPADLGRISLTGGPGAPVMQAVTPAPANPFSVAPLDTNSNGRMEKLVLTATLNVTTAGSYWMEALLVDSRGMPVAWSSGSLKSLAAGANQTLQILYDGPQLFEQLPLAGSKAFTLTAVKIFSGTEASRVLEADIPVTAFTTPAYARTQMERTPVEVMFEDDLEGGEGKWTKTGAWALSSDDWHSGTHAYKATGAGTLVTKNALSLAYASRNGLTLQFRHAFSLPDTGEAKVQISTDGTNWTTLKTFTGATSYWTTEQVDITDYRGNTSTKIRFTVTATGGEVLWLVDDLLITTAPHTIFLPAINR